MIHQKLVNIVLSVGIAAVKLMKSRNYVINNSPDL